MLFLSRCLALVLLLANFAVRLAAQSPLRIEDLRVIQGTLLEKDYQEMLFNYLLRQAEEATLQCTATGQVVTSLGGKRLYDYNRAEAERLMAKLAERRHAPGFRQELVSKIRERLALPSNTLEPQPKKVGELTVGDLFIEKLLVETEPGVVPTRVVKPKNSSGRLSAVLYLRDRSGSQDDLGLIEPLVRQGRIAAVADVRGFGETMSRNNIPSTHIDYFDPRDGMDADYTYASYFLGRPLLGMRVWDALQVATYLRSRPDVNTERISVAGRGWGGVTALIAAAVDSGISGAGIEGVPASYSEIARSEVYQQPVSLMLPGVLQDFDLSDVFGSIAPRPLLVMNPTDELTRKMTRREALEALGQVREAYATGQSPQGFKVDVVPLESEVSSVLSNWLAEQ